MPLTEHAAETLPAGSSVPQAALPAGAGAAGGIAAAQLHEQKLGEGHGALPVGATTGNNPNIVSTSGPSSDLMGVKPASETAPVTTGTTTGTEKGTATGSLTDNAKLYAAGGAAAVAAIPAAVSSMLPASNTTREP